MLIGRIGAQVALLAFSLSLLAGLLAGNTPVTVLSRALLMLVVALVLGQLVAWCGHVVLLDYLTQRKATIDTEHAEQRRQMREQILGTPSTTHVTHQADG